MAFRGVDYFCVDSLFSEEELMVRQTARRFAEERILPLIRDCYREGRFPVEIDPGDGGARLPRRQSGRLRLRRHEQRRVRPDHAGTGARRFRRAQLRLRAGRAGHVPHPSPTAARSRSRSGCPPCRAARRSAASASPSPISAPIPPACAPPRGATAMAGCSTARRPGSPTAARPMWPWSGRAPRRAWSASWWSAARRATPPRTSTANGRCARR